MNVEIWSDVVCPWCYIGKRRFETALGQFAHRDEVVVVWRSFELDPHAERLVPGTLNELLARKKGGTPEQAAAMSAQITALAATEGLEYHLDQARSGNTFDAHRLLHLAAEQGRQGALKERLMRAYFTEGRPIGEAATLVALAAEVGIAAAEAAAVLAGDAYAAALGITGVPFVVVDGRYGVSGAQPPQVFLNVLEQAWAESPGEAGGVGAAPARERAG